MNVLLLLFTIGLTVHSQAHEVREPKYKLVARVIGPNLPDGAIPDDRVKTFGNALGLHHKNPIEDRTIINNEAMDRMINGHHHHNSTPGHKKTVAFSGGCAVVFTEEDLERMIQGKKTVYRGIVQMKLKDLFPKSVV